MEPSTACLNCTQIYTGSFCPACGQKAKTHRITFGGILHEIPHSVWHVDKGFIYTFTQLLRRPGHAIREFIQGKRVKHYSPFAYLFILSAGSSLVGHFNAFYFKHFFGINVGISSRLAFPQVAGFFNKYPALMLCLIIPVISLWTYLFNRNEKYNYSENLVLNTYVISQFNFFFILHYLYKIFVLQSLGVSMIPLLAVFFAYTCISYAQFFKSRHSFGAILKRACMYVIIVLTFITGLSLAGFMTPWWRN